MKLFVNNLTNVDFSFLHPERGLMGESWLVQLALDGALDEQGMVCDFGVVKKLTREWMDSTIDHALLVPLQCERARVRETAGVTEVEWHYPNGQHLHCRAPSQAITPVPVEQITPLTLAAWCRDQLLALFPSHVRGVQLSFVAEPINGAYYHYSHGLHQHAGNCQRIAHGHRSRIEVYLNGQRDESMEQQWAERWQDIYIGSTAHRVSSIDGINSYTYQAPQGEFLLSLPTDYCYDIDTESTVEQIARHLALRIKQMRPLDEVEVRAYEGIGKGAIAIA